jgi:hypothetical protein
MEVLISEKPTGPTLSGPPGKEDREVGCLREFSRTLSGLGKLWPVTAVSIEPERFLIR